MSIPLILKPTPCHRLDRASEALGIDLWVKRDDLTGFAMGGNKGRKLEFLIADALAAGASVVVTCGASQSNFVRQLAAACAVVGLRCVAVVMDQPFEPGYEVPVISFNGRGNLALNDLFGAEITRLPNGSWDDLFAAAAAQAAAVRETGAEVYEIPIGGNSVLGVQAFYDAADELPACDVVVTATSSGSTHLGLHLAFHNFPTRVIGVSCDPEPALLTDMVDLGNRFCSARELALLEADELDLRMGYVGPGYGVPSPEGDQAMQWLARHEGIVLDPIYSAKAFAGLLDMASSGEFEAQTVVFWHTGGTPALFAYR